MQAVAPKPSYEGDDDEVDDPGPLCGIIIWLALPRLPKSLSVLDLEVREPMHGEGDCKL